MRVAKRSIIGWLVPWLLCALTACASGPTDGSPEAASNVLSAGAAAPSVVVCPAPGQLGCGGVCVNASSDPHNCGGCGRDCGAGACASGVCVCPSDMLACALGCTDTASDPRNCGGCGLSCQTSERCQLGRCMPPTAACAPACSGGQLCSGGVCQCPSGQLFCAGVCLDPLTTPQHCGVCDNRCSPGQLCQAGQCVCGAGQMDCGAGCIDLLTSDQSCGACGNACPQGQSCMAGQCRAPLGPDGCSGAAHDISLSEVAAYQTIKVPLSDGTTAIATQDRSVDVIQGRKTLFRVKVNVGPGFAPRELSARVHVSNGATSTQYFAKQRISRSSLDSDTSTTFQVAVPADQISDSTRYAVELVECADTSSGSLQQPRFPAQGDLPLDARKTGVLRIKLIPLRANGRVPDTSDTALAVYQAYMEAMYPIEKVEFSVGDPQDVAYPVNWNNTIDQLRQLRQRERPDADIYYYGMLAPAQTLKEYCRRGCTAGVGYVADLTQAATRVAMGLAFGDETSGGVMAHEVGHNHGRAHAPCAPGNQISGVDRAFPYGGALTKVWGYDSRKQTFFDPDTTKDIMGYCEPKWISDYTYAGLIERVADLGVSALVLGDEPDVQPYNVMLIDRDGPRWSQPFARPDAPFGAPEQAQALDIDGQVVERITVYRTLIGDNDGATLLVPPAKQGWNAVRTADGATLPFSAPISVPAM